MITLFENFIPPIKDEYVYYKIYTDKSIDKFKIALNKLGVSKEFFSEFEEIENSRIFVTDFIYFIICDGDFYIEEDFENLKEHYNFNDFIYGGEIRIEDYEVKTYKYNL